MDNRRRRRDEEYYIGDSSTRSYSNSRGYSRSRSRKKYKTRLYIRRAIIVAVCALLIAAVITLGWLIISGIGKLFSGGSKTNKTETTTAVVVETTPPTHEEEIFIKPSITDTGEDGERLTESLYLYNREAFNLFGGSEKSAQYYGKTVNSVAEYLGSDVTLYSMVVPNHTEYGLPQRVIDNGAASNSQSDNLLAVHRTTNASVKDINCYNILSEHCDDYIYFHTDHHWTSLGAYYAYSAFCEQTNQTPMDINSLEKNIIAGFTGTFYRLSGYNSTLANNPDVVEYYTLPNETYANMKEKMYSEEITVPVYYSAATAGEGTYGIFCWGDTAQFVIHSDCNTSKKILMLKDSYGNAFAPYLTANYDEVHILDYRYWEGDLKDYIKSNGIDEVLILNNVMAANTVQQVNSLAAITSPAQ